MRINYLYTLRHFVDLIVVKYGWQYKSKPTGLDLIKKYNDFLKIGLTKDMFVCEVEEPIKPTGYDNWREGNGGADGIACVNYQQILSKYEEAQKKVIFDQFINFNHVKAKTLYDLAEATNGELKLKNVEL